jgi:ATP-dependent Clp protease adaptor protein ClpS
MACEVDESGRVIVATCHKELAELRVEQIHEYGADRRMKESQGPMKATMQPAE